VPVFAILMASILLVLLAGDVDHNAQAELTSAVLGPLAGPSPVRSVLVDLSECQYLDSAALSVFLSALKALAPNGWLGFVDPSTQVLRLIQIVGIDSHDRVKIFESQEAGLEFLSSH
jgi:anti-anti-sigma factor